MTNCPDFSQKRKTKNTGAPHKKKDADCVFCMVNLFRKEGWSFEKGSVFSLSCYITGKKGKSLQNAVNCLKSFVRQVFRFGK